jgi:DNA polymerase delta subunit 4
MAQTRADLQALFPHRKKINSDFSSAKSGKKQLDASPSINGDTKLSIAAVAADDDNDEVEEILKEFDMNTSYGPCLGLSRMERWQRAAGLGLNPSHQIKDILERAGGMPNCLWEGRV